MSISIFFLDWQWLTLHGHQDKSYNIELCKRPRNAWDSSVILHNTLQYLLMIFLSFPILSLRFLKTWRTLPIESIQFHTAGMKPHYRTLSILTYENFDTKSYNSLPMKTSPNQTNPNIMTQSCFYLMEKLKCSI